MTHSSIRPNTPIVSVAHVNHAYGGRTNRVSVLHDLSLEVHEGERVILTGPSGSGKTTLLTLFAALREVQSGRLEILGRTLTKASGSVRDSIRREVGFIFQHHNLFDTLTARENVELGLKPGLEVSSRECRAMALEALDRVGLADRAQHRPEALSGGQRQRVAIARAMVRRPRLILADEPTASLDGARGRQIADLLSDLTLNDGATLIMVTHDSRIHDIADRVVELVDGRLSEDRQPRELPRRLQPAPDLLPLAVPA